jgi:N-acetylglutamate synthase-like GNAT family acetyltransferase
VFIARASRHDKADVKDLLEQHGLKDPDLSGGTTLIAREGVVAGCVRLIEVEPNKVVVDDFLVKEDRRGQGIGKGLMQAAMNNKGGTLYLATPVEYESFFEGFGFTEVAVGDLPESVRSYFDGAALPEGDIRYLTAR